MAPRGFPTSCATPAARRLALRVQQPVRHAVQALGERGEVARIGIRRARVEIAVGHCIGRVHDAGEGAEHQSRDQRSAVEHEDPDFERDEDHDEHDAALRRDRERELRGRHTDQQREGDEEGEIEQQLDAERRPGAFHGTPR